MSDPEPNRPKWREWLTDLFSGDASDEDAAASFRNLLSEAAERELLSAAAIQVIQGALRVTEIKARDIMVPRATMTYLELDDRPAEFVSKLIASGHSRFPVVGDDVDDVRGILHAKDLLPMLSRGPEDPLDIRDVLRKAKTVPESQPVYLLLQQFQSTRTHMAIVVDEYGQVSGLVTIEDVLEELVGDIEDEHDVDDEKELIQEVGEGTYSIKASTPIEVFDARFDTNFANADYDTVGGMVVKSFGKVPRRGDETRIGNRRFKVVMADRRRIRQLEMTCHEGGSSRP